MNRLLLAVLVGLAGCGGVSGADDFRNASPSRQGIEIKVPSNGQALTSDDVGQNQQALLGQTAAMYQLTRGVTLGINAGTAGVLLLCETIVSNEPTTVDTTHAVWGPWTDALSPNTYRFTVTKNADSTYSYVLEGKAKTDPDSAYLSLISGTHKPGAAKKQGEGSFTVSWDNCQLLPEHGADIGTGDFTYSRNANLDVTVTVAFKQVKDNDHPGQKIDANYAVSQLAGADGSFDFKSIDANANTMTIKSRWQQDGAGRSDAKAVLAAGGSGTASECWGNTFLETYFVESWDSTALQGKEADCAFSAAEYSTL